MVDKFFFMFDLGAKRAILLLDLLGALCYSENEMSRNQIVQHNIVPILDRFRIASCLLVKPTDSSRF